MQTQPTVFVVDPDATSRATVRKVVEDMELLYEEHESGRAFLDFYDHSRPGCAVLSLRIPDIGGLQIQAHLAHSEAVLPVIFVTGHADVPSAVRAMRAGAVQFHEKPVNERELWDSIQEAMYIDQDRRHKLKERQILEKRLQDLTPKEREVLKLLAQGKSVKEIAAEIEVGVRSIEMRRANLMKKLEVGSVAELLQFIERVYDGRSPSDGNGNGVPPSFFQRPQEHYWCTNGATRSLPARKVSS